ncbi:hypothetical protein [Streptomyces sp. NPDC017524]|uniref:hypothetical protein n=1 Tax=Streptomyces sp. NPDC017524 TaxID=3364999 RepID=UPI0037BAFD3D
MPTENDAVAALARVQALHRDDGTGWCPEEPFIRWPCPTIRAIDGTPSSTSPEPVLRAVPNLPKENH